MSIQHIFVISRAGSLIYSWEAKSDAQRIEKSFEYPMSLILEEIDNKATVVFGEREGIKQRYYVTSVNGNEVSDLHFVIPRRTENDTDQKHQILNYLEDENNYPVNLRLTGLQTGELLVCARCAYIRSEMIAVGPSTVRLAFAPPSVSTNEKIILSSTFHSLFTIAVQLSPVHKSSGVEMIETNQFRLHCMQPRTGIKFVVITGTPPTVQVEAFMKKLYELYADFALKNPFYSIDMPIRCPKFADGLIQLLEKFDKPRTALTV